MLEHQDSQLVTHPIYNLNKTILLTAKKDIFSRFAKKEMLKFNKAIC